MIMTTDEDDDMARYMLIIVDVFVAAAALVNYANANRAFSRTE